MMRAHRQQMEVRRQEVQTSLYQGWDVGTVTCANATEAGVATGRLTAAEQGVGAEVPFQLTAAQHAQLLYQQAVSMPFQHYAGPPVRYEPLAPISRIRAESKALQLLERYLNEKQLGKFIKYGWFDVEGNHTGNTYRLVWPSSVYEMRGRDYVGSFCINPIGLALPHADILLAKKLAFEADEENTLRIANRTDITRLPQYSNLPGEDEEGSTI